MGPECHQTVAEGQYQPQYQCAEFVSRSLINGGYITGISPFASQNDLEYYKYNGKTYDLLWVSSKQGGPLGEFYSSSYTAYPTPSSPLSSSKDSDSSSNQKIDIRKGREHDISDWILSFFLSNPGLEDLLIELGWVVVSDDYIDVPSVLMCTGSDVRISFNEGDSKHRSSSRITSSIYIGTLLSHGVGHCSQSYRRP